LKVRHLIRVDNLSVMPQCPPVVAPVRLPFRFCTTATINTHILRGNEKRASTRSFRIRLAPAAVQRRGSGVMTMNCRLRCYRLRRRNMVAVASVESSRQLHDWSCEPQWIGHLSTDNRQGNETANNEHSHLTNIFKLPTVCCRWSLGAFCCVCA
jgi:hypothetical protein